MSIVRCKCISKRWRTLLSDPSSIIPFLRIKHDQQTPLLNQFLMIPTTFADHRGLVLAMPSAESSSLHLLQANPSSIFSYLPFFQGHDDGDSLRVSATYNDLILCSPTKTAQRDYYICNSYTKEWIRLPPTPRIGPPDLILPAGIICEPYYDTSCGSPKLNPSYRFRVVRLLSYPDQHQFNVEIYFSETGEWREYLSSSILCEQKSYCFRSAPSIAFNGKLYWMSHEGYVFALDPFSVCSTSHVIEKCCFIDLPCSSKMGTRVLHIGVCLGCLRICSSLAVWELKESEVEDNKSEWCLLLEVFSLTRLVQKQYVRLSSLQIVCFDPIDRDIMYLHHKHSVFFDKPRYIVMCNLGERTLYIAAKNPFANKDGVPWDATTVTRYVIPWWPTPLQARLNYHDKEEYLNITVVGDDIFTVKVQLLK